CPILNAYSKPVPSATYSLVMAQTDLREAIREAIEHKSGRSGSVAALFEELKAIEQRHLALPRNKASAPNVAKQRLKRIDLYRALSTDGSIGEKKLQWMKFLLSESGWDFQVPPPLLLESYVRHLASIARVPSDFREMLPKNFLAFRQSFLVADVVN